MFTSRAWRAMLAAALLLAVATATSADTQIPTVTRPDDTLYTTYSFYNGSQNIMLTVCGYTQQTSGCYGSGSLGPFGHVGALIESTPTIDFSTNTVTRNIYVVDQGVSGAVKLYVYRKTDVVTPSDDTVTVTHTRTVALPLIGGADAVTYLAANKGFLFIGTNKTQSGVRVQKRDLMITRISGFSAPVSSITADDYGYVTVTFGQPTELPGMLVYDPAGNEVEAGGGIDYMLGTTNGFTMPASASSGN